MTILTACGSPVIWRTTHWEADDEKDADDGHAVLSFQIDHAEEARQRQRDAGELASLDRQLADARAEREEHERLKAASEAAAQQELLHMEASARMARASAQVDEIFQPLQSTTVQQHMSHTSPFAWLPDAILVDILAALTTPDVCNMLSATRSLAALRAAAPFADCHLRDGVPAGYGVRPFKQMRFAKMLGDGHARLQSMHVDHGRDELDVLRWLLQECDTSQLKSVTVSSMPGPTGQLTAAVLFK